MIANIPVLSPTQPTLTLSIVIAEPNPPKPPLYTIKQGDTLTSIASTNHTSVARLWAKNTDLANPDVIKPEDQLTVPLKDEQLPERPMPSPPPLPAVTAPKPASEVTIFAPRTQRAAVPGNLYDAGNCTWFAKDRRPDLPNNLGNADTWYERAAAQGFAVGSTPAAGAVAAAIRGMHVAIVTGVTSEGTIELVEMNSRGFGIVSTRTAPASNYRYIY